MKKKTNTFKSSKKKNKEEYSDQEVQEMIPKGLAKVFVNSSLESAQKEIEERGLEMPTDYEGTMPELPNDIAGETHADLSNLLAQFQNAHSTAIMAASGFFIWSNTYDEIADYLENRVLLNTSQTNDTKRKAEARTDKRVVFFRSRQLDNHNSYVRWRDLAKTIDGKIKIVSRVGGFIGDDNDASDLSAHKRSTRAKSKGSSKGRSRRGSR